MKIVQHVEFHHDGLAYVGGKKAHMVAGMYLFEEKNIPEVAEHYNLTPAQVHAAIAFYYDNQEELDAQYEANWKEIERVGTSTEAFRARVEAHMKELASEQNQE